MVLLRTSPWVCAATVLSAVDQVRRIAAHVRLGSRERQVRPLQPRVILAGPVGKVHGGALARRRVVARRSVT